MYYKIFEDPKYSHLLSANKLFALCLYKNLFPTDYALLEKRKGLIPCIIDIELLRKRCAESLKVEKEKLQKELYSIHNVAASSFDELRGMLVAQLRTLPAKHIYNNINPWTIQTFEGLDFSQLAHPNHSNYGVDIKQTELFTASGDRFIDLEKAIKQKENNEVQRLDERIDILNKQLTEMSNWTLKQVVDSRGLDFCFYKFEQYKSEQKDVSEEQLQRQAEYLRFLMVRNYIDEHFIEYTSNYQSGDISAADTVLLKKIMQWQPLDFSTSAENIESVIRSLGNEDFLHESVLIKAIMEKLDFLLELTKEDANDCKYKNLMNLFASYCKDSNISIFEKFLAYSSDVDCERFFRHIIDNCPTLCSQLLQSSNLALNKKDLVVVILIKYATNYKIQNQSGSVSNYLSLNNIYYSIFNKVDDNKKVIKFLLDTNPLFVELSADETDKSVWKTIIEQNMYVISYDNIDEILYSEDDKSENSLSNIYSRVKQTHVESLRTYVEDNIDQFVSSVLLHTAVTCLSEREEYIEELLKNNNITVDNRKKLIEKINFKFNSIKCFDEKLYETLIKTGNIKHTWYNLELAFEKIGFEPIKELLENIEDVEGAFEGLEDIAQSTPVAVVQAILQQMNCRQVAKLLKNIDTAFELKKFIVNDIVDENLAEIINSGKVKYCNDDLVQIHSKPISLGEYINYFSEEIQTNFDAFFNVIEPLPKQKYNNHTGRYYTVQEMTPEQNVIVIALITCKNPNRGIISTLLQKYENFLSINGHEDEYIRFVLQNKCPIPTKLLWQLIDYEMDADKKFEVLQICHLGQCPDGTIDQQSLQLYLSSINDEYNGILTEHSEKNIENSLNNQILVEALEKFKLIHKHRTYKKIIKITH